MKNNISMRLVQWLDSIAQPHSEVSIIVAYSGGRDSHVLLHALQALRDSYAFSLSAIHVNHGLQPDAKYWADHCQAQTQAYQVNFLAIELQLSPQKGQSIEELAREQRYAALKAQLPLGCYLVTAHTQEDQAETVMLQLLRGAGPKGLAGMAAVSRFGYAQLVRPLLDISRADIANYANHHQLCWIEDGSNQNNRFARNFLRNQIMPPLKDYFPGMSACLARSAAHLAKMQDLLEEYIAVDLAKCLCSDNVLDLSALALLSMSKQVAVLRAWFSHLQLRSPSTRRLYAIWQQALTAKQDAKLCIVLGEVTLRRYQNKLFALRESREKLNSATVTWDFTVPLSMGGTVWQARKTRGQGIRSNGVGQRITVRTRQGGEKCRLAGEKMTRSLKKIYQQLAIPYWQREQLPLLYQDSHLVGAGDAFICDGWQVQDPEEEGWVIERVV